MLCVTPPSSCLLIPSLTRSQPHHAGPVLITEQKGYPGMALPGAVWWMREQPSILSS